MSRAINQEMFDDIKKCLDTPLLVKPSVRYVAKKFGYSSSTLSRIKNARDFKEYKSRARYYNCIRYIDGDLDMLKREAEKAKKEIEDFNNEWYFKDDNR